tara:strand:- start:3787 stop:4725 length:939 start_codon:yes stop_codon:yes gene_type:complete
MFAVAKFGSHCRDDQISSSDQDLLLVCDKVHQFKYTQEFKRIGYSVSSYTPKQLHHMRDSGSLFLQHLKLESLVTHDTGNMFRDFLETCELRPPSNAEITRCEESIRFLLSWPEASEITSLKVDCLYCLVRDYLIKQLSRQNILAFGMKDIVSQASTLWNIPSERFWGLRRARDVKNLYRLGSRVAHKDSSRILVSLVDVLTRINDKLAFPPPRNLSNLCEAFSDLPPSNYLLLRTLEAANTIAESRQVPHPKKDRIHKLITNPNAYGSSSKFRRMELVALLNDIIGILTTADSLKTGQRATAGSPINVDAL